MPSAPIPLGPFLLDAPVGTGGMGVVWAGVHASQGTPVAVKVLTGKGSRDPIFLEWFRNEVRAAASLDHRAIAMVFDHGQIDAATERAAQGRLVAGSPYLVMELVEGGTLSSWCGRLDWGEVKDCLLTLLDALGHAHARGVIHRDLKASNILHGARPVDLKLVDFGLAHLADRESSSSDEARVAGTPAYMAPEQFDARWRDFGPWTDLYAVGCLGHALTAGQPPFGRKASVDGMREAHLKKAPPALVPCRPVAPGFEAWLSRLLQKDPSQRFRRAADAAHALRGLGGALEGPRAAAPAGSETRDAMTIASPSRRRREPSSGELPTRLESGSRISERGTRDARRPEGNPSHTDERTSVPLEVPGERGAPEPLAAIEIPPQPLAWRRESRGAAGSLVGVGLGLYGLRPIPLVDRERERELLWRTLGEVRERRRAQVVILRGAAGCGKSRLAEWLCERAHEVGAANVFRALHGPTSGAQDGLAPMLARALRSAGLARRQLLLRIHAALREQGFPDADEVVALTELLAPASPDEVAAGAPMIRFSSPAERYALLRRFLSRAAAERPSLVWLDDVQWGRDALEFAQHVLAAQAREPSALLLVITARDEELPFCPAETALLQTLASTSQQVEVLPLGPDDRRALVRELLGLEGTLAEQVEARTAGNPLFAVQLVGDWVQRGLLQASERGFVLAPGAQIDLPTDLQIVWAARRERLLKERDPQDALALELAAVLGQEVDFAEWSEICGRAGVKASSALVEELLAQRLARASAAEGSQVPFASWSFVHGAFRESVEAFARSEGRASGHHARCAALLEEKRGRFVVERRARHLLAAGKLGAALAPLLEAARERLLTGDIGIAESMLAERERVMAALAVPDADERRGWGWIAGVEILERRGEVMPAQLLAARTRTEAKRHGWKKVRAHALAIQGRLFRMQGEPAAAKARLRAGERLARGLGEQRLVAICQRFMGRLLGDSGQLERAAARYQEAIVTFGEAGDQEGVGYSVWGLGSLATKAGRFDDAAAHVERAMKVFERCGSRHGVALCLNMLGEIDRFRGALDPAEGHYRSSLTLFRALGATDAIVVEQNLCLVLIERGRFVEARESLHACLAHFETTHKRTLALSSHLALLPCCAAAGDFDAWDAHLLRIRELARETGFVDADLAVVAAIAGELAREAKDEPRARQAFEISVAQYLALGRRADAERIQARLAGT